MSTVFDRYVWREVGRAFAVGLGLFVAVVTFAQVLKLTDGGHALGLGGREVAAACLYGLPPLLGLLLPITWLYACLLTVGRLAQDREVLALAQTGAAPWRLLGVPLRGGAWLAVASAALLGWGEPWGIGKLGELLGRAAQRALVHELAPQVFHGFGGGWTFFVEARQGPQLQGLLLAERRGPTSGLTLQAARATVAPGNAAHEVIFALEDGSVVLPTQASVAGAGEIGPAGAGPAGRRFVSFARGRYRLDATRLVKGGRRTFTDDQGRSLTQLWQDGANPASRIVLHRKLALPVAAPLFGALAVPLGLGSRGSARARSLLLSAAVVGAYYYVGRSLELSARHGQLAPWLAAWLPNALGALALAGGLWALRRRRG